MGRSDAALSGATASRGGECTASRIIEHMVAAVMSAEGSASPFPHLVLRGVFPQEAYAAMLAAMPANNSYRPMHGRSRNAEQTRVKLDLLPEYVRKLAPGQRAIWSEAGRALRSREVKDAFMQRLAPGLERRFGADYRDVGMYPIPILTRDIPGYSIPPHTDTHWKGITVQLYLPADASAGHIGTIFHEHRADGAMPKVRQMAFVPNSGYAFAVGDDTWHSADKVGPEVKTRDSILLTYFVDRGAGRQVRNRGKRLGNMLLNEFRHIMG